MAKNVKTIETLCERAERKGEAYLSGRYNYGTRGYYDVELEEKYRVVYTPNVQELYHWGTLTASIQNGVCVYIYGESVSDADSIETFLNYYNIDRYYIGYRPVNGGLYVQDTYRDTTYTGMAEIHKHFDFEIREKQEREGYTHVS